MEYTLNVLKNVLTTVYKYFGASILVAILFMFFFLYTREIGLKNAVKNWISAMKEEPIFRRVFFLVLYVSLMLFQTVLCRNLGINPLKNILGVFSLTNADGTFNSEGIENIILFIPYTPLIFGLFRESILKGKYLFMWCIRQSIIYSFLFSIIIEFLQLFFKLGTFQISDLVFNTLGGLIGGLIYALYRKIKK